MRWTGLLGCVLTITPASAWAQEGPDKATCISAYEQAQELRLGKKLLEARKALLICAASSCPQVARVDCSEWLADVERATPSVVPQLRDGDDELITAAKLYVDDALQLENLDGSAFPLDPGPHRFRFETPDGETYEKEVVVVEGQKRQTVLIRTAPEPGPPTAPERPQEPDETTGSPHWSTWVLTGVSVAGFGVFAGLGGYSLSLEGSCKPTCTENEQVPEIERFRVGADIGLTVGAVSGAAALMVGLVTALSGPDDQSDEIGFAPLVSPNDAGFAAWLRF